MVNKLSTLLGRRPFLKNDFHGDGLPRSFGFLIRPTAKEFRDFVHTLDKMLSENIDPGFFGDDVTMDDEVTRRDERVEVRRKGTIRLLEEWLTLRYRTADDGAIREILGTLKHIRKLRQRPAYAIDDDLFNQGLIKEERDLMARAYRAANLLRRILASHPAAKEFKAPRWIESGKIYVV